MESLEGKLDLQGQITGFRMKDIQIETDSLCYSWGSANNGKLGISSNIVAQFESGQFSSLYCSDTFESNLEFEEEEDKTSVLNTPSGASLHNNTFEFKASV